MYEHDKKRPWITTEEWAHSDLLTGNAGKIKLTSADSSEFALEGLRVKTFHAGTIDIMGNNGHGGNAPLIFIVKAGEDYKCECCQETKPSNEYDECILRDTKQKKLLCLRCQRFGFSFRDLTKYSCACNYWPQGHLNFRTMDLSNWKRGKIKELHCRICRQEDPHQRNKEPHEKFQCRVCGSVETGLDAFNKDILFNYRVHGRRLLCTNCQERGLSPRDFNRYVCRICNCEAGHLHFVKKNTAQLQTKTPVITDMQNVLGKRRQIVTATTPQRCLEMQVQSIQRLAPPPLNTNMSDILGTLPARIRTIVIILLRLRESAY